MSSPWRAVPACLALALACGGDGAGPGGNPGPYQPALADDWSAYPTTAALVAAHIFGSNDPTRFDVDSYVAIVTDPTFGKVARITQPEDTNSQANSGWTPELTRTLPALLNKAWFRFRVKFSPGWTTVGPYPANAANAYKLVFVLWESGYTGRAQVEYSNTDQYILGIGGVGCTETGMPGSQSFGHVTTEWTDGEWWEFVLYYEKRSPTSQRMRWWRRQLTQGGTIVNNAFTFFGLDRTSCGTTPPRVRAVTLGGNKNRTTPADQYIYWGPWEVVDGSVYPDPYGVGP